MIIIGLILFLLAISFFINFKLMYRIKELRKNKSIKNGQSEEWLGEIIEIRNYSQEQFDRLIVYLSSGALVLTIGFVNNIIKITKETNTTLLQWSWIMFACALIINLLSHKTSIISMDFEILKKREKSHLFDDITNALNWASACALISGIVIFLIFIKRSI